jgi:hypothetical protein
MNDQQAGAGGAAAAGGASGSIDLGQGDLTLLVVFDKSGSMASTWDDRTKWEVANQSFMSAIVDVVDNLTIGTIFFPQPGGCDVAALDSGQQLPFAPGPSFYENWPAAFVARGPDGSTPLEHALRVADAAIEQGCNADLLNDRFRVILVTDGEPTCGDNLQAMIERVAEWNRIGVETWVMGLPGSSLATELLNALAAAGSTGEARMLSTPEELDAGLHAAAR